MTCFTWSFELLPCYFCSIVLRPFQAAGLSLFSSSFTQKSPLGKLTFEKLPFKRLDSEVKAPDSGDKCEEGSKLQLWKKVGILSKQAYISGEMVLSFPRGVSPCPPAAWLPCQRATGVWTQTQTATLTQTPVGLSGTLNMQSCEWNPITDLRSTGYMCFKPGPFGEPSVLQTANHSDWDVLLIL